MSEAVDKAQITMPPKEIEFWNRIKNGTCPCGGRLVPHIEHWVADEIDWVKAVGLECENRCGFDLNMTEALTTALEQAAEIEQLRSENDRLISDIRFITAPVEVGGGADAYLRYEVDRLRRERDTLDSGLDGLEQAIHYQDWPAVVAFFRAARRLLDGEKGGGGA